jgi:hypothetical protein
VCVTVGDDFQDGGKPRLPAVILSAAKDLRATDERSFAALRMTTALRFTSPGLSFALRNTRVYDIMYLLLQIMFVCSYKFDVLIA